VELEVARWERTTD